MAMTKQEKQGVIIIGVFSVILIIIMSGVLIYLHSQKKFPFDDYKRTTDKSSNLQPLFPDAKLTAISEEEQKARSGLKAV